MQDRTRAEARQRWENGSGKTRPVTLELQRWKNTLQNGVLLQQLLIIISYAKLIGDFLLLPAVLLLKFSADEPLAVNRSNP